MQNIGPHNPSKRQRVSPSSVEEQEPTSAWDRYRFYLESIDEYDNPEGDIDELIELVEGVSLKPTNKDFQQISLSTEAWNASEDYRLRTLCSVSYCMLAESYAPEASQPVQKDFHDALQSSLRYFPYNANAWSIAANQARLLGQQSLAISFYERAVLNATQLKNWVLQELLPSPETIDKEWIELLLLNQMLGIQLEDDDSWSPSAVEGTVRFMAAIHWSTVKQSSRALEHLQKFDLTHRVHPNVWANNDVVGDSSRGPSHKEQAAVTAYDNVLPPVLYNRLCNLFSPKSAYWKESDYEHRGYYSYFVSRKELHAPTIIDQAVEEYLLPLVERQLQKGGSSTKPIVGFEWWVHHRPTNASLGHNLHFDTDEALLSQEGRITHPVYSSVLYLTGGEKGGATIIFEQTPEATTNAERVYKSVPQNNRFLIFPGNLLHGVLPCPLSSGTTTDSTSLQDNDPSLNLDSLLDKPVEGEYRLTLMVGFWTRSVPEEMRFQKLYGPCGPIPWPKTTEWVREAQALAVTQNTTRAAIPTPPSQEVGVPVISPAWERLDGASGDLQLPRILDHRFFVKDSPQCFYDSLFEKDEFDEDQDDEEDGESEEEEDN